MKKSNKSIITLLIIIAPLFFCVASYSQDFEIIFGEGTDINDIISDTYGKAMPLKWINVNTLEETWSVKDDILVCKGLPIGVIRSEKQYENFILHVEWNYMVPGGNSGVFVWSGANPPEGRNLPDGVEVQMLELDYFKVNPGTSIPKANQEAYVHGHLFGVGGVTTIPDNQMANSNRSNSLENRCLGHGSWNTYTVVAVDGVLKLSVNGKFVNGISQASQKKGYICLESEGAEIHFRNIRIIELPEGVTSPEQIAPLL